MNRVQSSRLDSPSLTVDAQRLLTLLIAVDAGSSMVFVRVTALEPVEAQTTGPVQVAAVTIAVRRQRGSPGA
jgi:hypothetical protein